MEVHTVTEEEIRKECKNKIDKYEKLHYRDINLGIIPEGTTMEDVNKILNIMIRKGYTFLAAYVKHKDRNIELIHVGDIEHNTRFDNTKPGKKKINSKIAGMKLGIINNVTLNQNYMLIDGLAALIAMKLNNEKYVPFIMSNQAIAYGKDNRHPTNGRIKIRKQLFDNQNGKCYICGKQMTLDYSHPDWTIRATVDHMIPLSKGGSNSLSNCRLCCSLCNQLKSDELLTNKLKNQIIENGNTYLENRDTKKVKKKHKHKKEQNNGKKEKSTSN